MAAFPNGRLCPDPFVRPNPVTLPLGSVQGWFPPHEGTSTHDAFARFACGVYARLRLPRLVEVLDPETGSLVTVPECRSPYEIEREEVDADGRVQTYQVTGYPPPPQYPVAELDWDGGRLWDLVYDEFGAELFSLSLTGICDRNDQNPILDALLSELSVVSAELARQTAGPKLDDALRQVEALIERVRKGGRGGSGGDRKPGNLPLKVSAPNKWNVYLLIHAANAQFETTPRSRKGRPDRFLDHLRTAPEHKQLREATAAAKLTLDQRLITAAIDCVNKQNQKEQESQRKPTRK